MKLVRWTLRILVGLLLLAAAAGTAFYLRYPNVPPPEDLKVELTPERLERGRYLAHHVAMCIDCHSKRDFHFLAGPVVPGTEGQGGERFGPEFGVPGEVYAPNLTPSSLGGWTDGQILRAITTGVSWDGRALFPMMPYPSYRKLSRADAEALVAYIRSLTLRENVVPPSHLDFPMNLIVRLIPKPADPSPEPDPKDTVAYGRYLVTVGACSDCHTPREKGRPVEALYLAGGTEFVLPGIGTSRSANITPAPGTAVGNRSREAFIQMFKQHADPRGRQRPVEQGAFNTIMPWTAYGGMTEEDLGAIYDYLKTVPAVDRKVETFTPAP